MNERIKEIADECGLYIAYDNKAVTDKEIEFFAELIVRECVEICMKEFDTGLLMAPQAPWIAEQIKEHFGIEE